MWRKKYWNQHSIKPHKKSGEPGTCCSHHWKIYIMNAHDIAWGDTACIEWYSRYVPYGIRLGNSTEPLSQEGPDSDWNIIRKEVHKLGNQLTEPCNQTMPSPSYEWRWHEGGVFNPAWLVKQYHRCDPFMIWNTGRKPVSDQNFDNCFFLPFFSSFL